MAGKKSFISFALMAMLLTSVPVSAGAEASTLLKLDAPVKYPGDAVKLTGTAPFNDVVVKMVRPDGTVLYLNVVKTDKGAFADSITLPADAMLGTYTVVAGQGNTEKTVSTESFSVAKKPDGGETGNPGTPGDNGGDTDQGGSDDGNTDNPGGSTGSGGNGGQGGGNSGDGSLPAVSVNGTSVYVTLPSSAFTSSEVNENGTTITKVSVDETALSKAFQALKGHSSEAGKELIVSIPVSGQAGTQLELPAAALKAAQVDVPNAIVAIQSGNVAAQFPVRALSISRLESALQATASDIKVVSTMKFSPDVLTEKGRNVWSSQGIISLSDPVTIKLSAVASGKQVDLDSFVDGFITKKVTLSSKIDPGTTTVAAIDPQTGELRFVPSVFQSGADGETVAVIKHSANETYMIVSSSPTFKDANGHWAQQSIEHLASKRIVNGSGLNAFDPEGKVTRAEFAALLVRATGFKGSAQPSVFPDVQADDWFADAVQAANERGLVDGLADGTFQPHAQVTREQMAVMIERAMTLVEVRPQAGSVDMDSRFTDANDISGWAKNSMELLVSEKLLEGVDANKLAPKETATRAETVMILERFLRYAKLIN